MLGAIAQRGKMRVGNIKMRINAEGRCEIAAAVGVVAAEEIAIIEIPVSAGKRDWLRRLMDRIFVALGQHCHHLFLERPYHACAVHLLPRNFEWWRIPSIAAKLCNTRFSNAAINEGNKPKTERDMILERERMATSAKAKLSPPASGYFGYTYANLVGPRSKALEAELFARFGSETRARVRIAGAL